MRSETRDGAVIFNMARSHLSDVEIQFGSLQKPPLVVRPCLGVFQPERVVTTMESASFEYGELVEMRFIPAKWLKANPSKVHLAEGPFFVVFSIFDGGRQALASEAAFPFWKECYFPPEGINWYPAGYPARMRRNVRVRV